LAVVLGVGRAPGGGPPEVAQRQLEAAVADDDMARVAADVVDDGEVAAAGLERALAVALALAGDEGVAGRAVDEPLGAAPALALVLLAGAVVDVLVGGGLEAGLGGGLDPQAAGQQRLVAVLLDDVAAGVLGEVRLAIGEDVLV